MLNAALTQEAHNLAFSCLSSAMLCYVRSKQEVLEMNKQYWLAELDKYGNPTLTDGAHSDRNGAEEALTLRKRLPMISTEGKKYAIAEVILSEPTGEHGDLNEDALKALGA
jgi:hypothetical protein